MQQCRDCEFFFQDENGRITLKCNPFLNVKEPACVEKWQLLRLDMLMKHYQTMLQLTQKYAPLQEKMFKFMQRELNDIEDADSWKYTDEEEGDTDEQNGEEPESHR